MRNYQALRRSRRVSRNVSAPTRQRMHQGMREPVRLATDQQKRLLGVYTHAIRELKVVYRLLITANEGIRAERGHGGRNTAVMGQSEIDRKLSSRPYTEMPLSVDAMDQLRRSAQPSDREIRNAQRVAVQRIQELESAIATEQSNIGHAVSAFKIELQNRFRANGVGNIVIFQGSDV